LSTWRVLLAVRVNDPISAIIAREVVVAGTNGQLDGSTELAEVVGTWEQATFSACQRGLPQLAFGTFTDH
jgi:hypothetical protein